MPTIPECRFECPCGLDFPYCPTTSGVPLRRIQLLHIDTHFTLKMPVIGWLCFWHGYTSHLGYQFDSVFHPCCTTSGVGDQKKVYGFSSTDKTHLLPIVPDCIYMICVYKVQSMQTQLLLLNPFIQRYLFYQYTYPVQ